MTIDDITSYIIEKRHDDSYLLTSFLSYIISWLCGQEFNQSESSNDLLSLSKRKRTEILLVICFVLSSYILYIASN